MSKKDDKLSAGVQRRSAFDYMRLYIYFVFKSLTDKSIFVRLHKRLKGAVLCVFGRFYVPLFFWFY